MIAAVRDRPPPDRVESENTARRRAAELASASAAA